VTLTVKRQILSDSGKRASDARRSGGAVWRLGGYDEQIWAVRCGAFVN
jgi:hypothetical protein